MTGKDTRPAELEASPPGDDAPSAGSGPALRLRAEAAYREQVAQPAEGYEALSPEATRQMLHELHVHQIELEMQNEELRRAQVELDAARARYFDLYDLAPVGYCILSEKGLIQQANLTAATLLGVARGALVKQPISRFILMEDQDAYYLLRKQVFETGAAQACELKLSNTDGTVFWAHLAATLAQDAEGAPVCRVALSDITERKQLEDQIRQLAFRDTLTKLPNRRLLNDRLSQSMAASKRSGCYGALMFLDLDNFKLLNDTHGHAVGDLLLIEAADRLKRCVREMDTVARFGGDEFVVTVGELDADESESTAQAGIIAEKIRAALAELYALKIQREGKTETIVEHHCTASIGVALFGKNEASRDNIIKWADLAMYRAKEAGCNSIRFYDSKAWENR